MDEEDTNLLKTRRPKDTRFKQQKLRAWQPIMTAGTVIPIFIAIGIVFIPLGVGLLVTSNGVQEIVIDYTDSTCRPAVGYNSSCAELIQNYTGAVCNCTVDFQLTSDFLGSVYLYYGLTNYYQNHRRYVASRDDDQLHGMTESTANSLSSNCDPYRGNYNLSSSGIPYAPCGSIANSLFNDSLSIVYVNGSSVQPVGLLNTGIAWTTDVNGKFQNPATFNGTLPPPYWSKPVYELDPANPANNGYENEDLIVWMRTAAFPSFRKLYRRVNQTGVFAEGLPAGNYTLLVQYAYPVSSFGGQKQMILTTTSWLGGKNSFLGIAYLVVGSLSTFMGFCFIVLHWKYGKKYTAWLLLGSSSALVPEPDFVPLDVIHSLNRQTKY